MFSELIDEVVLESRRGVASSETVAFANATLRECQTQKGAVFDKDLIEDSATTGSANPYVWTFPTRFRKLKAVKYTDDSVYPRFIPPGTKIGDELQYFYAASDYYAFFGAGITAPLALAYYIFSRRFKYYAVALRPAVYDEETETWSYLAAYDTDDANRELARNLVTNWMLRDWYDTIKEGTVAKVLKRAKDDKVNVHFASYKSMQKDIFDTETRLLTTSAQSGGSRE